MQIADEQHGEGGHGQEFGVLAQPVAAPPDEQVHGAYGEQEQPG